MPCGTPPSLPAVDPGADQLGRSRDWRHLIASFYVVQAPPLWSVRSLVPA